MFSPVPFQSYQVVVPPSSEQDTEQQERITQRKGFISAFQGIINDFLIRPFYPNHVFFFSHYIY